MVTLPCLARLSLAYLLVFGVAASAPTALAEMDAEAARSLSKSDSNAAEPALMAKASSRVLSAQWLLDGSTLPKCATENLEGSPSSTRRSLGLRPCPRCHRSACHGHLRAQAQKVPITSLKPSTAVLRRQRFPFHSSTYSLASSRRTNKSGSMQFWPVAGFSLAQSVRKTRQLMKMTVTSNMPAFLQTFRNWARVLRNALRMRKNVLSQKLTSSSAE